jgi:dienelactone hydrolase
MICRPLLAVTIALGVFFVVGEALAEVRTKIIEYKDGEATLKGMLAWDDATSGKRPGVLVVHEWWGLNDYAKYRAKRLAEEGYIAFALDMYGDDKVTKHAEEAGAWAKQVAGNIEGWRARANRGLEVLKEQPQVDASNVAAIGYCFGGSTVMQMAYAGSDVKAVVSFHGSLPPAGEEVTSIKPRVLVAHGRDDGFIPAERVIAFQDALDRA